MSAIAAVAAERTEAEVQAWVYLATAAIPFLVAVINRPSWPSSVKRWVTITVSVLISGVLLFLRGDLADLDAGNVFQHIVTLVGLAQFWYAAIAAVPAGKKLLDKVEVATTPKTNPPRAVEETKVVKQHAVEDFKDHVDPEPGP